MPAGRFVGMLCALALLGAAVGLGGDSSDSATSEPAAKSPAKVSAADKAPQGDSADAPASSAAAAAPTPADAPAAASAPAADPSAARYTLRYRFLPGEELRWEVVDEKNVGMNVGGTETVAEMYSRSVKIWRIKSIQDDGSAVIENLVDEVEMRQKMTGRMEVRYNSRTDKNPPLYFESIAKSIGVPLSRVTIDVRGKLLKREQLAATGSKSESEITLPLPEKPVAVGETWTMPADLNVPLKSGTVKKLKTQQAFTLEKVENGVATIRMATQILTPVSDPALQTQIMHRETQGAVRFDLKAGRILAQSIAIDKRILGFSGDASVCQYKVRFSEKLTSRVPELGAPTKAAKTQGVKATPSSAEPIKTADARASAAKSAETKPAEAKSTAGATKPSDSAPPPALPKAAARPLLPAKAKLQAPGADAPAAGAAPASSPAPEAPLPPSTKLTPDKSPASEEVRPARSSDE